MGANAFGKSDKTDCKRVPSPPANINTVTGVEEVMLGAVAVEISLAQLVCHSE